MDVIKTCHATVCVLTNDVRYDGCDDENSVLHLLLLLHLSAFPVVSHAADFVVTKLNFHHSHVSHRGNYHVRRTTTMMMWTILSVHYDVPLLSQICWYYYACYRHLVSSVTMTMLIHFRRR